MLGPCPPATACSPPSSPCCWGLNFPAIHLSLEQFPPFFLVALRFALIAVPTLLLVPRPTAPWRWIALYGLGFGVLQFVFLYLAMSSGMPTGLASLVLQSSAPFTVVLAGVFLRERITARQGAGILLAVAGLGGHRRAPGRAGGRRDAGPRPADAVRRARLGGRQPGQPPRGPGAARRAVPADAVDVRRAAAAAAGAVAGRRGARAHRRRRSRTSAARRGCSRSAGCCSRSSSRRSSAPGCGPRSWAGTRPAPSRRSRCWCPWSASAPSWLLLRERTSAAELAWGALVRRRACCWAARAAPRQPAGDDQRRRDRRDALAAAGEPEPVGGGRRDAHGGPTAAESAASASARR